MRLRLLSSLYYNPRQERAVVLAIQKGELLERLASADEDYLKVSGSVDWLLGQSVAN